MVLVYQMIGSGENCLFADLLSMLAECLNLTEKRAFYIPAVKSSPVVIGMKRQVRLDILLT